MAKEQRNDEKPHIIQDGEKAINAMHDFMAMNGAIRYDIALPNNNNMTRYGNYQRDIKPHKRPHFKLILVVCAIFLLSAGLLFLGCFYLYFAIHY